MSVRRTVSEIFSVKKRSDPELNWGMGRSRSLKMAPFDRAYTTFYMVLRCKYRSIRYRFWVIWRSVISWPWNLVFQRSLKVFQNNTIRKSECGFLFAFHSNYGHIFSHFGDIQRQGMTWPWNVGLGCSRSQKMAPFDRTYATFFWSAVVTIALSCTIFEFFLTSNNIVTLKSGLEVTQSHWNWCHSKAWLRFPIRLL